MTKKFQELSNALEEMIKIEPGILGSALFDSQGQLVLGTQNLITGTIKLRNQIIDSAYISYVSTAVSEKIRNSVENLPSSELFDDIFLLDEENALFSKSIDKKGYNLVFIAKKTVYINQKLQSYLQKLVKELGNFISGS